MTYSSDDRPVPTEIEVTPEMVRAGVTVEMLAAGAEAYCRNDGYEPVEAAFEIWSAMSRIAEMSPASTDASARVFSAVRE